MEKQILKELKEIKSDLEYIKDNMICIDVLLPEEELEAFSILEE